MSLHFSWPFPFAHRVATALLLSHFVFQEGRRKKEESKGKGAKGHVPFYQEGSHFLKALPTRGLLTSHWLNCGRWPSLDQSQAKGNELFMADVDSLLSILWSKIRVLHSEKEWGGDSGK